MFDIAAYDEAIRQREPSLDRVVFVAVKTTGIYCRPVYSGPHAARAQQHLPDATDLPNALIARNAGFSGSLAMGAAFVRRYRRPPSALRKRQGFRKHRGRIDVTN